MTTRPSTPDVSVVVPTHDRPEGLMVLAGALGAQTLPRGRFEVIVVDDGSHPSATVDVAGVDVRILRHERARGPAAARNTGWRAAGAPLVAFTDDDCIPVPGWLEALVATAAGDDDVIVQGPVRPPPAQRDEVRPLSHTIEMEGPNPFFVTCNIAYARDLLDRVGGFDERQRRASGEDVDLGVRSVKAGARTRYAPHALVHHEVRQPTLVELVRQAFRGEDSVRVLSLHPELREHLVAGLFWKPTHPRLLLAAAGLLTRRPWIAAAAAVPYLDHYRRLYRSDPLTGLRELPRHVVVDVCEVATMIRGSVRHRTLML